VPSTEAPVRSFQGRAQRRGQAPQCPQARLVLRQFRGAGQVLVNEQVGNFLELAVLRQVQDVVAAIVQVIARAPDGAQRRVAGNDAGERDGFLGLGRGAGGVGACGRFVRHRSSGGCGHCRQEVEG